MRSLRVEFDSARRERLIGSLDLPDEVRHYAVFTHCFTCNRNYKFIRQMARALAERGIGVLRFDFAGLGDSGGDFEETNLTTNTDDVVAAAGFLEREYGAPSLLVGHSLGGCAVLAAAGRLSRIRAVATINTPYHPAHVLDKLQVEDEIAVRGHARVELGGLSYRLTAQLAEDLRSARPDEAIAGIDAALLVLHAPGDRTAPVENGERIFAAARHPRSLVALPGADHLLSRESDAVYAAGLIATWSAAYLGGDAA